MDKINFPAILITDVATETDFEALDAATHEWEMRAARGECAWVCASCCMQFDSGMPDSCPHDDLGCTKIIQRDKLAASSGDSNA